MSTITVVSFALPNPAIWMRSATVPISTFGGLARVTAGPARTDVGVEGILAITRFASPDAKRSDCSAGIAEDASNLTMFGRPDFTPSAHNSYALA